MFSASSLIVINSLLPFCFDEFLEKFFANSFVIDFLSVIMSYLLRDALLVLFVVCQQFS